MTRWPKLVAIAATLTAMTSPLSAQSEVLLEPAQIVSAAQDCIASSKDYRIEPKLLKKRGWKSISINPELKGVVFAYLRMDGAFLMVIGNGCLVKARMSPAARDNLPAAVTKAWGINPVSDKEGVPVWKAAGFDFRVSPGPADGTNVNLSVRANLDAILADNGASK